MSEPQFSPEPSPTNPRIHQLAGDFRRLGWIGFGLQAILGFIPLFMLLFVLFFKPNINPGVRGSSLVGVILSYICLTALVFTTYWCFRYTQVSKNLEKPGHRPQKNEVIRCLWIGLAANIIGMICAVFIGMIQIGNILLKILLLPPGSSTIFQPAPGAAVLSPGLIFTPFDMIAMQAIMNTIAAELVGIIVALWLLFRVIQPQSQN